MRRINPRSIHCPDHGITAKSPRLNPADPQVVIDYPPAWRARFEAAPPNGLPCGNYTPDYLHMGRFFQAPAQPFDAPLMHTVPMFRRPVQAGLAPSHC